MKFILLGYLYCFVALVGFVVLGFSCNREDLNITSASNTPVIQPSNSLYHKYGNSPWISSNNALNLDTIDLNKKISPGTSATIKNNLLTIIGVGTIFPDTALKLQVQLKSGYIGTYSLIYDRNAVDVQKNSSISFFGRRIELQTLNPVSYNCGGTFSITSYDAANKTISGTYNFVQVAGIKTTNITGGVFKNLVFVN
jgi:hypothetical protein